MKSLCGHLSTILVILLVMMSGCTLDTPTGSTPPPPRGRDLLISEVFTISPSKYYAFSWIELYNPTSKKIKWFDETKPASGFAVGSGGAILHSTNDGGSWDNNIGNPAFGDLNSVSMSNSDTGYAVGDGGAFVKFTKNSAASLTSGTTANLHSCSAAPDQQSRTVFAVGDGGLILRTVNRGVTLTQSHPTARNLNAVDFISFSAIYAVGDSGTILKSTNAGTAWSQKVIPEPFRPQNYYSVNFVNDTGWVTGEYGTILYTENGGGLWSAETSKVGATLRGGFFPLNADPFRFRTGWLVGDSGVILSTADHGATWRRQTSGTSRRLNAVTFVDSSRGWVFGDGGLILNTANGGRTWHAQQSNVSGNLHGSAFTPLNVRVLIQYVLEMVAQRRAFFFDRNLPFGPGNPNYNYFTKIDSGVMVFNPQVLVANGLAAPADLNPGGFAVVTSDSDRFKDHTNLGPGDGTVIPNSIGYYIDPTAISTGGYRPVLWTLLSSGEIRLIKYFFTQLIQSQQILGFDSTIIDVVRYGNYRPNPDDYPNNQPAPLIPEWWSLARYSDDYGDIPSRENTNYSFFLAENPIPRWKSQLSHASQK